MSTRSNAVPGSVAGAREAAPAARSAIRPLYWSVRRELWENRSIYLAPLAVAIVAMASVALHSLLPPHPMPGVPADPRAAAAMPCNAVVGGLVVTAFIVGVFYCLDALHGERRDRSILFWKSLPVSDLTAVLSKASIPLVVLPLCVFLISVAAQLVMLLLGTVARLGDAAAVATLWASVPMLDRSLVLLYALAAISLWHAPVYAWLLLVSAWARRVPILWAALPLLVLFVVEMASFGTARSGSILPDRYFGWFPLAFRFGADGVPSDPMSGLTPGRFLRTPDLWLGLAFAAACLAATVWLRRRHEPI